MTEEERIHFAAIRPIVEEEIEEVRVAINNENLWAIGSETEEQQMQHTMNAHELAEYKEIIEYFLKTGKLNYDKEMHKFWIEQLLERTGE